MGITERRALSGKWVALEIYTPRTTPERRIAAVGSSPASCIQQLRDTGLDPAHYEFVVISSAF